MIYLATPYSHPDKDVEQHRYNQAVDLCALYMQNGVHVFSPIVHWHEVAKLHKLPTDAQSWSDYNMWFLRHSSAVWVVELEGWERSKGVTAEIVIARRLNLTLRFVKETNLLEHVNPTRIPR